MARNVEVKARVGDVESAEKAICELTRVAPRVMQQEAARYLFRFELELLLEKHGFTVESLFGGIDKSAFDGTRELVAVARKTG